MFDDIDRAQELDLARIEAIHEAALQSPPRRTESWATCVDCAEPIPEERRRAMPGARRCTFCQAQVEENA